MAMEKLDLGKLYKSYYTAQAKPQLIEFETAHYVTITGQGDPDGETFARATEALYTVSYGVKGLCKQDERDFTVPKLEGLWWVDGDLRQALKVPRAEWRWKLLIRMPTYVALEQVDEARQKAMKKKKELVELGDVRFEKLHEGQCVQMLHVGPYATEPETLRQMEDFINAEGWAYAGLHHEIYLSDPRRVEPAKMKTILRYPVARREKAEVENGGLLQ
ncbi:GyrI-like domain-containing protein [Paenibacillus oryzisoli]|uniref:GyrI-like domain-containing protein n=1 Tax=Paenibacillus oryzisoli TaxID=1850517 RepID=UPI003D2AF574